MSDENNPNVFNTIEEALTAIRQGEMIMVVDDDDRENEGDLIMAASKATPEAVAFMIRHTSGILCTPILQEQAVKLHLDPMVSRNDAPMSTAFTVSIDYKEGLTTGISAEERAATTQALTNSNVTADDFVRPGHIFPLVARQGGVLVRSGHTEAGTDLAALAGLPPVGLLAELVNDNGTVQRLPEAQKWDPEAIRQMKVTTSQPVPGVKSDHVPVEIYHDGKASAASEEDTDRVDYRPVSREEDVGPTSRIKMSRISDIR